MQNLFIKFFYIAMFTFVLTACGGSAEEPSDTNLVTEPVSAPDTTAPVIVLNGSASITIELGDTFDDPGATATDNYDSTVDVFADWSNADFETLGKYTIVYSATDASGNTSTLTRELIVEPPPIFTIVLEWVAPQFRQDGAPLSLNDIASYKVYMGNDESDMNLVASVDDARTNSVEVPDLERGVYYISISAVDDNDLESPTSDPLRMIL